MATALDPALSKKSFNNWLKGALAVLFAREGLIEFVKIEISDFQRELLQSIFTKNGIPLGATCSSCTTANMLRCPTQGFCDKTGRCKLHDPNVPSKIPNQMCPNNICHNVKDVIRKHHRFQGPTWQITDATKWCSDEFQIAKCYLPPKGYDNTSSFDEIDFNGTLGVIINNTRFQNKMAAPINICSKVRDMINENIRLSASYELSDIQLVMCIDALRDILQDARFLLIDQHAQVAVQKLNQLQNNTLVITAGDITKVLNEGISQGISKQQQEAIQSILDHLAKVQEASVASLGDIIDARDKAIKAIQLEVELQIKTFRQVVAETDDVLFKDLKEDIITYYQEHESGIPVFPLVDEYNVPFEELYVLPPLWAYKHSYNAASKNGQKGDEPSGHNGQDKQEITISELFLSGNIRYRKIYITANAGLGKTALSKKLTMTWCQSHSPMASLTKDYDNEDLAAMKYFDLLFLLRLRDNSNKSKCNLDDFIMQMVTEKLPRNKQYTQQFVQKILHKKKCLIILDGLDDWAHPGHCSRKPEVPHNNFPDTCTVLTTTKDWKIGTIGLSPQDIDRRVEISMLNDETRNQLEKNVIGILNERNLNLTGKHIADFDKEVRKIQIGDMIYIPYILLQMLCLFLGGFPFGKSKCEIYSNITEFTLQRGINKKNLPDIHVESNDNAAVINCMKKNEQCIFYFNLIMRLGKLAFFALFSHRKESSLVFDREYAHNFMTKQEIEFCLKVGLLCQTKDMSLLSVKRYKVFFQHRFVQEFFSAIFITSEWQNDDHVKLSILEVCSSLSSTLEMENVFIFVSGINPEVYSCIFGELRKIVEFDSITHRYRTDIYIDYDDRRTMERYQSMQVESFQESVRNGNKHCSVYLQDILLTKYAITRDHLTPLKTIMNFNKAKMKTLFLKIRKSQHEKITVFLQSLEPGVFSSLETFRASLRDEPSFLADIITEAPTLKYLYISSQCWRSDVTLDLTYLTKLTALRLSNSHRNAQESSISQCQLNISSDMQELERIDFNRIKMAASWYRDLFHNVCKIRRSVDVNVKECCGPSEKEWNDILDEIEALEIVHVTKLDSKATGGRSFKIQTNMGSDLPAEILRMKDEEAIELYEKALVDGEEKVYNIRLMIVGHFGVGKTVLTKRLLNENFDITKRVSTEGIDLHIGKMKINLENGEWSERTTDVEADFLYRKGTVLAQHQHRVDDTCPNTDSSDSSSDDELNETEKRPKDKISSSATQNKRSVTPASGRDRSSVKPDEMLRSAVDNPHLDRNDLDEKHDKTRQKYEDHKSQKRDYLDEVTIEKKGIEELQKIRSIPNFDKQSAQLSVWDFAGQYAFYDTHQVFMSWRTIYLLVTNLSKQLTDTVEDDDCYVDSIGKIHWKVSDFASFWLNAINECSALNEINAELSDKTPERSNESKQSFLGPPVILVGTFADTLEDKHEGAKRLEDLKLFLKKQKCTPSSNLVEKHFVIDNKSQIDSLGELRETILEMAKKQKYWGERVPARWIDMEIELHEMKTRGIKILMKEDLTKKIKENSLSIPTLDELNLFLKFHHETGNIIHYHEDKSLSQTLVLDPQWLINAFKRINQRQESSNTEQEILKQRGILTESHLDEIWKDEWLGKSENDDSNDRNKSVFVEHSKTIRAYLEKLGLFAKPHTATKRLKNMDEFFFVPSLLKETVPAQFLRPSDNERTTSKLYFEAKPGFLPSAVFNKLLASCIASYPLIYDDDMKTYRLFCGYGQFYFKDKHKLSTLFKKNVIEIWLSRQNDTPSVELFREADKFVGDILKTCCKQFIFYKLSRTVQPEYLTENLSVRLVSDQPKPSSVESFRTDGCLHPLKRIQDEDRYWKKSLVLDDETFAKRALKKHLLPDQQMLNELANKFGRKSNLITRICKRICVHIAEKDKSVYDVWPAVKINSNEIVFVIIVKANSSNTVFKQGRFFKAIRYSCVLRSLGEVSYEGKHVINSKQFGKYFAEMTASEKELLKRSINSNNVQLMRQHKYLMMISGSPVRSKGHDSNSHIIDKETCIVLYVLIKGYIPINEEPFQTEYEGFPVDVREGLFQIFTGPADRFDTVKHGCQIITHLTGTLGGFVDYCGYGTCGLTCAHVVLDPTGMNILAPKENNDMALEISITDHIVYQPDKSDERNAIGNVVKAIYREGGNGESGIDLAVFHILQRYPVFGDFPELEDGHAANKSYDSGKVADISRLRSRRVYKYGAATYLTSGEVITDPSTLSVRTYETFEVNKDYNIKLHNLLEIQNDASCNEFAKEGDSGALVFCEGENNELICVGMVEGGTGNGTCVVIPILPIVEQLNLTSLKSFQNNVIERKMMQFMQNLSALETRISTTDARITSSEQNLRNVIEQARERTVADISQLIKDLMQSTPQHCQPNS